MGDRIKELRQKRNWTQKHLAKLMNVVPSAVHQWETNVTKPSPDNIVKLANLFKCSTDKLLGRR